jgi:hypothetical protein
VKVRTILLACALLVTACTGAHRDPPPPQPALVWDHAPKVYSSEHVPAYVTVHYIPVGDEQLVILDATSKDQVTIERDPGPILYAGTFRNSFKVTFPTESSGLLKTGSYTIHATGPHSTQADLTIQVEP